MSAAVVAAPDALIDYAMPAATYHALDDVGSGGVKLLLQSPAHYHADAVLDDDEGGDETKAQAMGTAIHLGAFEPERFASEVVAVPADAPKRPSVTQREAAKPSPSTVFAIDWWNAWDAEHHGHVVLGADDFDTVRRVIDAIHAHRGARTVLGGGAAEVTMRWRDPATGVRCKGRIDYLRPDGIFVDLKSARDASPAGFQRAIAQHGYAIQAAHYYGGSRVVLGAEPPAWIFIAAEKVKPYAVGCYVLDRDAIDSAASKVALALERHAECTRTGRWPAYSDFIEPITLPKWAL